MERNEWILSHGVFVFLIRRVKLYAALFTEMGGCRTRKAWHKLLLSSSEPADHDFAVTLGLAWTETGRKRKRSAQPVPV